MSAAKSRANRRLTAGRRRIAGALRELDAGSRLDRRRTGILLRLTKEQVRHIERQAMIKIFQRMAAVQQLHTVHTLHTNPHHD